MKNRALYNHIIDYALMNSIYMDFDSRNYSQVKNQIIEYGEFDFFVDLTLYLKQILANKAERTITYKKFVELYFTIF